MFQSQLKKRSVKRVRDLSRACAMLLTLIDKRPVYGKHQKITEPPDSSLFNIAVVPANPAQRGSTRCAEDDAHRRIPERSSDECHPPDRSPQCGDVVLDFPARRRRTSPAIWCRRKPAPSVPSSDGWRVYWS